MLFRQDTEKARALATNLSRWSGGQRCISSQQFNGWCQSIGFVVGGADEVFKILDKRGAGKLDIEDFSKDIVGSGKGGAGPPASRRPATPPRDKRGTNVNPTSSTRASPSQATGTNGYPYATAKAQNSQGRPSSKKVVPLHAQEAAHDVDFKHLIVAQFRKVIVQRGGSAGIHALGRSFMFLDKDHNQRVDLDELRRGLRLFGVQLEHNCADQLMQAIDVEGSGSCTYNDFLVAIRGPVSKRRRALIDMAFKVLDRTGDGRVTIDDVTGTYDVNHDPDVKAGRLAPEKALGNFLSNFDCVEKDGVVTEKEFQKYYKNVSASIEDDDYFELMIRNAWHIPGGKDQYANTANHRCLVTCADGSQKVVMIEQDLGLDMKSNSAVLAALKKQGLKNVVKFSTSGKS